MLLAGVIVLAIMGWSSAAGTDIPSFGYVAMAVGDTFFSGVWYRVNGSALLQQPLATTSPPGSFRRLLTKIPSLERKIIDPKMDLSA
jgi:hypothetical protein